MPKLPECGTNVNSRVRLALKPRFLSKGLASQSVRICVFVLYDVTVLEGKGKVMSFPCLFPGQHDLAVSKGKIKGKMHSRVNF